ncbi:hypothetical protein DFH28DRAFT_853376, partial [Melampsora americana]
DKFSEWYPFKRKEQLIEVLIIGTNQNILSRAQYQRIQSILHICNVNLPEWGSVRALSCRLKDQSGLKLNKWLSPMSMPLFGLNVKPILQNELANPLVSPHLVFLPELPSNKGTNCLSQCKKWCEDHSPLLRLQMVVAKNKKHIYIYKPVQLQTHQLVVPIFFHQ